MEIGLDQLYRETTRGEWGLAAFWLPPLFWRHLMADLGESPLATQDLLSVVRRYHLFLVPRPLIARGNVDAQQIVGGTRSPFVNS